MRECTICYETRSLEDEVVLPCTHTLCVICYESILNNRPRCPYCRYEIEPDYKEEHDEIDPYDLLLVDRVMATIISLLWGFMFIYGIPIRIT